jgi:hypothetical protein
MFTQRIEPEALIQLLQIIEKAQTLEEQLSALELAVTAAELNPNPKDFYAIRHAIETLRDLNLEARDWQAQGEELKPFFVA